MPPYPVRLTKGFIAFNPPPSFGHGLEEGDGIWVYPKFRIQDFGSAIKVQFFAADDNIVAKLVEFGWIDVDDEFTKKRVEKSLKKVGIIKISP